MNVFKKKQIAKLLALSAVILLVPGPRAHSAEVEWKRAIILPNGQPAVGVKVVLQSFAQPIRAASFNVQPLRPTKIQEFTTDEKGIFRALATVDREHNNFRLIVDAPGAALMFSDMEWQRQGQGPRLETKLTLDTPLRLSAAYTLSGRVVRLGRPVGKAKISVLNIRPDFMLPATFNWPADTDLTPQLTTESADDGNFTLRGFDSETLMNREHARINFMATTTNDGAVLVGQAAQEFTLKASKVAAPLEIKLWPVVPIRGKVVNAVDGKPLAGAEVRVYNFSLLRDGVTNARGEFEVNAALYTNAISISAAMPNFLQMTASLQNQQEPGKPIEALAPINDLVIRLRPLVRVTGTIMDATTGQPPLVTVDLAPQVEEKLANGWMQQGGRTWGNGGADYRVRPDGSFSTLLPTGPVMLGVEGPYNAGRKPYQTKIALDIAPTGQQDLKLSLPRRPGVLVKMPDGAAVSSGAYPQIIVHVSRNEKTGFQYSDDGLLWFYPVEKWGDTVRVHVERRTKNEKVVLLPWTSFTASAESWPIQLKFDEK